jgi:peptidoglycan/LPS O-acetylase OafA/YrhL
MTSHPSELLLPKYRPDIDGLRAVAVLLVIGFHAFPRTIKAGFIGVDIFFVLSGYLISTIIFENLEMNRFSFTEFYARRIRRIFPALFVILLFCFCLGWFFLLPGEYKQLGKHIAAGAGFVSNFVSWNESGYFDNAASAKPLLHLWSLGIEEQFYLAWPVLLWLMWKRRFNFLKITIVVAGASLALNFAWSFNQHAADFYSPLSRFWELMAGAMLAYCKLHNIRLAGLFNARFAGRFGRWFYAYSIEHDGIMRNLRAILGILLIVVGSMIIRHFHFPGFWALMPVVGTMLIIEAGRQTHLNRVVLSSRVMVWLGLISYPLYMWHWPLLSFAHIVAGETPDPTIRMALILLATLLAWATYEFIEKPIRYGTFQVSVTVTVMGFVLLIGAAGYSGFTNDGFRYRTVSAIRVDPTNFAANLTAFDWPESKNRNRRCAQIIGSSNLTYCIFDSMFPVRTALIGDSHADAIFGFLDRNSDLRHKGLILLGEPGCPPFLGVERGDNECAGQMKQIVQYLNNQKDIEDVFITARFAATLSGKNFGGPQPENFYPIRLLDDSGEKNRRVIFRTGLESMIKALQAGNKRITILLDAPELNFDPKICLKHNRRCSIDRTIVFDRQRPYTAIIEELQSKYGFRVIDLKKYLCGKNTCDAKINGRILYRDPEHLGQNGNAYLIQQNIDLYPP